jgi:hypothetical protein
MSNLPACHAAANASSSSARDWMESASTRECNWLIFSAVEIVSHVFMR